MSDFFECHSCGAHFHIEKIEKHVKEIHFWNRLYPKQGINYYLDLFSLKGKRIAGEITPAYAALNISLINKIKELTPNIKIFYTIRNPIYRTWSAINLDSTNKHKGELDINYFNSVYRPGTAFYRGINNRGFCESTIYIC